MAAISPRLYNPANPGRLKDRAPGLKRWPARFFTPEFLTAARSALFDPFFSSHRKEMALVRRIRDAGRELVLSNLSDLQLRDALGDLAARCRESAPAGKTEESLVTVFAIVDEAIRRRLGAWRILDSAISGSSDGSGAEWGASIPLESGAAASAAILEAIEAVKWSGRGRYGSDLMLSAGFYRAVAEADTAGRFTFDATDQQLLAALHLHRGRVVEMQAGEGKTVAIAFAAVMHAVQGRSVHVITGNDYLADRDCRLMAPVFRSLDISVAAVLDYMDADERKAAYGCDVVYGTLREFGFDYLRDNVAHCVDGQVQPPLDVAIVDEADQALIDEAATPLIISGEPVHGFLPVAGVDRAVRELAALQESVGQEYVSRLGAVQAGSKEFGVLLCRGLLALPRHRGLAAASREYPQAYRHGLEVIYGEGTDYPGEEWVSDLYFVSDLDASTVTLTPKGLDFLEGRLGRFTEGSDDDDARQGKGASLSRKNARRLAIANRVYQGLRAHLLLERGIDYIVDEGAVYLLDRYTGRVRPDSAYRHGLHSALEARERVPVQPDRESLAQISVQGFARRYRFLSGITGTAMPAAEEFQRRYSLPTVAVPSSHGARRVDLPSRIYEGDAELLRAVVAEVARRHEMGQPALVGVRSIEQSELISRHLQEAGIEHRVLNAVNSQDEERIVRTAGDFGAVTVATNMAGRGTDITLADDLSERMVDRCLQVVRNRISGGCPVVEVHVSTEGEAALLDRALGEARELAVERVEAHQGVTFRVSALVQRGSSSHGTPADAPLELCLGLHVLSTQFNRFPRVAMQLRGRSGRQGSFGSTGFLLSLEDRNLFPPGKSIRRLAGCLSRDPSGNPCWQGPAVERYLRQQEDIADREAATSRTLANDFAAVQDLQTDAYYRLRQTVLAGAGLLDELPAAVLETARSLVEEHFPGLDCSDYSAKFSNFSRQASDSFGLALPDLYGQPVDLLPALLSARLMQKLEELKSVAGERRFGKLARQVFLECSDELWVAHQAHLQDTLLASLAGLHGHKTAVADYILHSSELLSEFRASCRDEFVSRLLLFPVQALAPAAGGDDLGFSQQGFNNLEYNQENDKEITELIGI